MNRKAKGESGKKLAKTAQGESRFPACGCWINLSDPTIGELVGGCGYDYALIDMEHSPVTLDSVLPMIRSVQLGGAKALVRVPDKQLAWIGRLMDMGADGVMVPMVNSVQEAEAIAAAAIYAPQGTRGMAAGIVRATGYGVSTEEYLRRYRASFVLMVQIETATGVDAAADIAQVDGVDCVFIGPFDLAGSLGNPGEPEHKDTRSGIRRIVKAVKAAGKPLSTLTNPARNARKLFAEGYDLVFSGSDVGMLRQALETDAAVGRKIVQGLTGSR